MNHHSHADQTQVNSCACVYLELRASALQAHFVTDMRMCEYARACSSASTITSVCGYSTDFTTVFFPQLLLKCQEYRCKILKKL